MASLLRNSKMFYRIAIIVGSLLAVASCTPLKFSHMEKVSLTSQGVDRHYFLSNPGNLKKAPIVFALHGGGMSAGTMMNLGFEELAKERKFIVIYPEAQNRTWRDGRIWKEIKENDTVNDSEFIKAIIKDLKGKNLADISKVYAVGISNGGMMAYRLACEIPEHITAFAAVTANMPSTLKCSPKKPIPALIINGTKDKLVPWEGGKIAPMFGDDNGEVISAKESYNFWRKIHRCKEKSKEKLLPKTIPDDETEVSVHSSKNCPAILYEIKGGGHGWPGRSTNFPIVSYYLSPFTKEVYATDIVLDFFKIF